MLKYKRNKVEMWKVADVDIRTISRMQTFLPGLLSSQLLCFSKQT